MEDCEDDLGYVSAGEHNYLERVRAEGAAAERARLLPVMEQMQKALRDLLDSSESTSSFCECCERHAPKDASGRVTGPVRHDEHCLEDYARAALAAYAAREEQA